MTTRKDAKIMAKSLRGALADRSVSFSHSDCLEIVARQFGYANWNTLLTKLPTREERHVRSQSSGIAASMAVPVPTPNLVTDRVLLTSPDNVETSLEKVGTSETTRIAAPWSKCSFCGKSRHEVRSLIGGCSDWEAARKRGGPEKGDIFICDECVTFAAEINADRFPPSRQMQGRPDSMM